MKKSWILHLVSISIVLLLLVYVSSLEPGTDCTACQIAKFFPTGARNALLLGHEFNTEIYISF